MSAVGKAVPGPASPWPWAVAGVAAGPNPGGSPRLWQDVVVTLPSPLPLGTSFTASASATPQMASISSAVGTLALMPQIANIDSAVSGPSPGAAVPSTGPPVVPSPWAVVLWTGAVVPSLGAGVTSTSPEALLGIAGAAGVLVTMPHICSMSSTVGRLACSGSGSSDGCGLPADVSERGSGGG